MVTINKINKIGSGTCCVPLLPQVMAEKRDKIKRREVPNNPKDNFE